MTASTGTLHGRLLEYAALSPDAPAVYYDTGVMTYGELDRRSALLAEQLVAEGARPGVPVGICVERTPDLFVAVLATLRSGACYLPLDPKYPGERLGFMKEDSGTRLILSTPASADRCPVGSKVLVLGGSGAAELRSGTAQAPAATAPADTAYVIYTSGSTGRPKAVPVRHSSCAAMLSEADRIFAECDLSGVAAVTSICFDLAVMEIFVPLSRGGAVVLVDSAVHLPESPHLNRVTHINSVPSVMASLLDGGSMPAGLRSVVLGGEAVRRRLVDRVYAETKVERVFNGYGPTEGTVFCTFKLVPSDESGEPSIGSPSSTARIHVLDDRLRPLPEGEAGELYLGGEGLAWGYLNRPGLTAERFVPDPQLVGERMYRTGDIGRFLPGGELEFVGRADHQVKVRGYRIELEEAESWLSGCPEVREAAVAVHARGGQQHTGSLVAYVVQDEPWAAAGNGEDLWSDEALQARITKRLSALLPDYMVPEKMVFLAELPVSPNGKLDRAALPEPPASAASETKEPASTPTEAALVELWAQLLDRDPQTIGVRDTFFDLGGDSLLLIRLAKQMTRRFGTRVGVSDLFRFREITSLAGWLDNRDGTEPDAVTEAKRRATARRALVRGRGRPSAD
ncbi:non-ribosomal peptide synthetase [Streptomyces sp. NBC_01794]|uniref:non-ribosomal peptide synthetase n=1 Tax=Streptomyces sp. NBC_01794 TaxID=2975942 RepID=UPI00308A5E54|nr:non-ribosomal peptide synthetase [Streptomyces sp. NBC_01794]